MANDAKGGAKTPHFTRIEKVLEYIHQHLFLPLSLEELADKSCWSRWQLQRVFRAATGINVAQYVRELKLSRAAERLLTHPNERILDVALTFGFNSEISFSRAFKQFFDCSPRTYRKQAIRRGLRQPLAFSQIERSDSSNPYFDHTFTQIRVEFKDTFELLGHPGSISGLFASQPDFQTSVPNIWQQFERFGLSQAEISGLRYGVIDTFSLNAESLVYWASIGIEDLHEEVLSRPVIQTAISQGLLKSVSIPPQHYAVLTYQGPIQGLKSQLQWLITHWLPQSGYCGVDGFELEIYPADFQIQDKAAKMEYWLPIKAI